MTLVSVIRVENEAVLVEYANEDKRPVRCVISKDDLPDDHYVDDEVLDTGIPYGEDWEEILPVPEFDIEKFADALRNNGIWTKEDLLSKVNLVSNIIKNVTAPSLSAIIESVNKL